MAATTEAVIAAMLAECREAGCSQRQLEAVRAQLQGSSQQEIAATLGISQPAVCAVLARARRRLMRHALARFGSALAWYRWLWHVVCGDIADGGRWRRATIGPPPAFDPLVDPWGNPVHFRVRLFLPEDMLG